MRYRVYGLRLLADAAIPGLIAIPDNEPADCTIHLGTLPVEAQPLFHHNPQFDDANVVVTTLAGAYGFLYRDGTRFLIAGDGRSIAADWPPDSTPEDTATYLLGPVLAFVLRLRGELSLHASAIVLNGRAVALAAAAGGGKSTTAAAFSDRGVPVMSDDVVRVFWDREMPMVAPGYPRLRLWPEAAAARYGSAHALPLLTPTWTKHFLDLGANGRRFQAEPLPLGVIVVLGERRGTRPALVRLRGHEAAIRLVANSSMALHLGAAMRMQELDRVAELVDQIPLFEAHASADMAHLDELCDLIAREAGKGALSS